MIKKILLGAAALFCLVMLVGAATAFAQGGGGVVPPTPPTPPPATPPPPSSGGSGGTVTLPNPLGGGTGGSCGFTCVADRIINLLFNIAIPLTAIMVLWGGFQMMTSSGDPEKFGKAQKTLLYAAIGFAVVLLARSVVPLIRNILGA